MRNKIPVWEDPLEYCRRKAYKEVPTENGFFDIELRLFHFFNEMHEVGMISDSVTLEELKGEPLEKLEELAKFYELDC